VISALYGVLVTLLLFLCVTLHEFGHAVVARAFDIRVPSIMLLPIGGLANLEKMPEKPSQEFFIAIAGPVVNIVLAILLVPVAWLALGLESGFGAPFPGVNALRREMLYPGALNLTVFLISTNLLLAFFNLLPAFPMDGGRILRSLLALVVSYVTATRIAVYVGRGMAVLFAVAGIFGGGIFLLLIAFFVYVGGGAEREAVEHRSVLRDVPVDRALRPDAIRLYNSERIGCAVDLVMQSYQSDFAVLDLSGRFVGVLTQPALITAMRNQGQDGRIIDVMIPAAQVPTCNPHVDLATVWETMARAGSRVAAILDGPRLVGLISSDDITQVIHMARATRQGTDLARKIRPPSTPNESNDDARV
jgi:Zn-dependent protease